jgi:hypothetical protein
VRYVYAGAYLEQVCEVESLSVGCGDSGAVFYIGDPANPTAPGVTSSRERPLREPHDGTLRANAGLPE